MFECKMGLAIQFCTIRDIDFGCAHLIEFQKEKSLIQNLKNNSLLNITLNN